MRRILAGLAFLIVPSLASAQSATGGPGEVRWFVDATNMIVNSTSFASVPIPPGHTAVLKSVVDAACSCASRGRGMWDGTTYTRPPSEQAQGTDAGQLKAAARRLRRQWIGLTEGVANVAQFWPTEIVSLGHDLLAYAPRGVRGVVLSQAWTVPQKIAFMAQMGLGPLDVTSPAEFLKRIEEGNGGIFPNPASRVDVRVLWVNPDTGVRVNVGSMGYRHGRRPT